MKTKSFVSPSARAVAPLHGLRRLGAIGLISLLLSLVGAPAPARAADDGFTFIVYGDSRTLMYLPYSKGQEAQIHTALVDVFALILGERIAEEIVKRDVKLTFDPKTAALIGVEMPLYTKTEVARLNFDQGWVTEASVQDTKLLPGVWTVIYRAYGGDWVGQSVAREVQSGAAKFIVHTGDVVWWGRQGRSVLDSPYWKRMNETVLARLPAPDTELRAAGLDGRYFPTVGNHEVWDDPRIEGVLSATPYLKKLGLSSERLIYFFDFKDTRFIFLWTGKFDRFAPSGWDSTRPVYKDQLKQLTAWLDDARAKKIRNVFVTFHNPVYNRAGFEPIPEDTNPHQTLASYAKDFAELVVFNGHVHTTELFDVDGVRYFVLGGGGAEQDPILPGRTAIPRPANYPPDLYWNGHPPTEEYNYMLVHVMPGRKSTFTLTRFRPWSGTPFDSIELFGSR